MKLLKLFAIVALFAVLAALLQPVSTTWAQGTATPTPKKGGTLRVAFAEWPKNLHAQIDSGTEGLYIQVNLTQSLINIDGNGSFVPGLAVAMPEQPDNKTFIFKLRQGVKFHNGDDFTADDVIWTFDRLLGKIKDQPSTQAARFKEIIQSVEALDKYTVKFTLNKPWDDFIPQMASDKYMDILNKRAVLEMGPDYGLKGAVGTGPFKFKEWVKGDHITIVRNENYWGTPAYLDAITYKAIPEDATRLIALKTGDVDLLFDPPLKDLKELSKDPTLQIKMTDAGDLKVFYVNTSRPPFNDLKVRQAVFYAIDRQAIIDSVYYGYAVKGQGIWPVWHWAFDPKADYYPYSPDKAKAMLAEAGYNDANPLKFDIVFSDASEYIDTATLIQAQLAKIGVKVTLTQLDKSGFTAKTWPEGGKANSGFQAAVYRAKSSITSSDYTWRKYSSQTSNNSFGYNQPGGFQHPEVDKMLTDSMEITDREQAIKVNQELSRLITEDAVQLVLGWAKNIHVSRTYVKDIGIFVRNDFPLASVWLDK